MLNRFTIILFIFLNSCEDPSNYDQWVKDELTNGTYTESVQFGLKLGDTKKDFFVKSWELNNEGKVTHGPNNDFIAYELQNMPEGKRINHLFYGIFNENDIMTGLDMRFYFLGWAPWNDSLQSNKALPTAMKKLMEWYPGSDFMLIENENIPNQSYVKIDGNRQIVVHVMDDRYVRAQLIDLRYKYPNLAR
tara:strand:- start:1682 stop:2254 length:573 start_codon:yes stop_codon:yes gene_type:complete